MGQLKRDFLKSAIKQKAINLLQSSCLSVYLLVLLETCIDVALLFSQLL